MGGIFYHWLWVTKFCAKFGSSRTLRTTNAHKSFIVLRCMWKEPAPFQILKHSLFDQLQKLECCCPASTARARRSRRARSTRCAPTSRTSFRRRRTRTSKFSSSFLTIVQRDWICQVLCGVQSWQGDVWLQTEQRNRSPETRWVSANTRHVLQETRHLLQDTRCVIQGCSNKLLVSALQWSRL